MFEYSPYNEIKTAPLGGGNRLSLCPTSEQDTFAIQKVREWETHPPLKNVEIAPLGVTSVSELSTAYPRIEKVIDAYHEGRGAVADMRLSATLTFHLNTAGKKYIQLWIERKNVTVHMCLLAPPWVEGIATMFRSVATF